MDELGGLIEKLKGEVAALEQAVERRHHQEDRELSAAEQRLKTADGRVARARATLTEETAAIAALEHRRSQLLARIDSWRGQLWRIGHGAVAVGALITALVPHVAVKLWFGGDWSLGLVAAQAATFALCFFVIPEKR